MIIFYTKRYRIFSGLIFILAGYNLGAQDIVLLSWEPEISATWKVKQRWQLNIKGTSLNSFFARNEQGESWNYRLDHVEFSTFGTYRTYNQRSLTFGYLYRRTDPLHDDSGYAHRLMQQLGFIAHLGSNRIGNRIRTEQRFRVAGLIHRWRYRLSTDFPLNGLKIDPGEMYLIASEELLWSFGKPVSGFGENRLTGGLGWFFSRKTKFEIHAQYRLNGFLGDELLHMIRLLTTFYINI